MNSLDLLVGNLPVVLYGRLHQRDSNIKRLCTKTDIKQIHTDQTVIYGQLMIILYVNKIVLRLDDIQVYFTVYILVM